MTDEVNLGSPHVLARTSDPPTSRLAAFGQRRRDQHLGRVLRAYANGEELTDVDASQRSGLDRIETTRRASELRNAGLIKPVEAEDGTLATAILPSGRRGMLCRITSAGRDALPQPPVCGAGGSGSETDRPQTPEPGLAPSPQQLTLT